MTTTPTFWSGSVVVTFDTFAMGPRVTALDDGTFVMSWENGTDIFARHLSEFGSFTGGNLLTTISGTAQAVSTPIITQQTGSVVLNYQYEFDNSPLDRDIRWASLGTGTTAPGSSFGTEASGYDEFLVDSAARTSGGGALLYDYTGPGGVSNLVLRFTDSIGNQASNQIFIDPNAATAEHNAAITGLHTGFMAVAYESLTLSGSFPRAIHLKVFTPGELNVSGDVTVSASNVNASFPDIIELEDGSFVVTWQQSGGIAFRRYFGNGIALDAAPVLVPGSDGGFVPKITALNDGGFVIAWTDIDGTESDGSPDLDLHLQRYDASGTTIGAQIHLDEAGDQGLFGMNIDTLADGRIILTYVSETGDATNLTTLNYRILDPRETTILGENTNDTIVGRLEASVIKGFDGNDKLSGMDGNDKLIGGLGNDTLNGNIGDDRLQGGIGDDILSGGDGADALKGGPGADTLTGGAGPDAFVFKTIAESTVLLTGRDTITDFSRIDGDLIKLRGIDADSGQFGNQRFDFIGTGSFSGDAGELRFDHVGGGTTIYGDVTGDGVADFAIYLSTVIELEAFDFTL